MNASVIRLKKEARALFWPWCAVTMMGVLPAGFLDGLWAPLEALPFMGFFFGIPLLATLSLGNEFHYRTLSLWLSQPSGRVRIWGEKLIVSFAAVLSAVAAFAIGQFVLARNPVDSTIAAVAIAYALVTAASATFWTLVARSTLGGLILNANLLGAINFVLMLSSPEMEPTAIWASILTAVYAVGIVYAGLMLWLGARKLSRFQVTGGDAGDDLLMSGPALMPESLAGWFRSRPSGASLNLIRKELRLLRPLWLSALGAALLLAGLAIFRLIPDFSHLPAPLDAARVFVGVVMLLFLLVPVLAGSLSLGEERTSGTHAWHLTLPVSARRQWFVKLAVAGLAALLCAVALPLLVLVAGGSIHGSPSMYVDSIYAGRGDSLFSLPAWLLLVSVLTLASFWCACATNGTVRAALWVFPVTNAIFFAGIGGMWLGQQLANLTGSLSDFVVSWFQLSPLAFTIHGRPGQFVDLAGILPMSFVLVAVLFGVIQSYRLFRTQPQDNPLWMLRCLLPLVLIALLTSLSVSAGFVFSQWDPFHEIRQALSQRQPATARLELAGQDLANAAPLSSLTRRWLRDSRISVVPDQGHSGYFATIHLPSGLDCRLSVNHYGGRSFSREAPSCTQKRR